MNSYHVETTLKRGKTLNKCRSQENAFTEENNNTISVYQPPEMQIKEWRMGERERMAARSGELVWGEERQIEKPEQS